MGLTVINTGIFQVNSLVVPICGDGEDGKKCFVVDPAGCGITGDSDKIVNYLKENDLQCVEIVLTHSHFDHITGIAPIKAAFPEAHIAIHQEEFGELQNAPGPMSKALAKNMGAGIGATTDAILKEISKQPDADIALKEGDDIFGWTVIHTPGHTPGSICLYKEGNGDNVGTLISGDTIFAFGGFGRVDLPGGSDEAMVNSLKKLSRMIPQGTKVYPGHDTYGFPFQPH